MASRVMRTVLLSVCLLLVYTAFQVSADARLPRRMLSTHFKPAEASLNMRALLQDAGSGNAENSGGSDNSVTTTSASDDEPKTGSDGPGKSSISGKDIADKARASVSEGTKGLKDKVGGTFDRLKDSVKRPEFDNKPGKPDGIPSGKPDDALSGGKPDGVPSGKPEGTPGNGQTVASSVKDSIKVESDGPKKVVVVEKSDSASAP